jgi:hypothetical protein
LEGKEFLAKLGRIAPRDREDASGHLTVIASQRVAMTVSGPEAWLFEIRIRSRSGDAFPAWVPALRRIVKNAAPRPGHVA